MWTHFTPAAHDHGMAITTTSTLLALVGIFNVAGTIASGWPTAGPSGTSRRPPALSGRTPGSVDQPAQPPQPPTEMEDTELS